MKKILFFLVLLLLNLQTYAQEKLKSNYRCSHPVCMADTVNHGNFRIPAPEAYFKYMSDKKKGRVEANRSKFIVEYIGFTEEAKTAFQKAVDIWESVIVSPVPIRVRAEWKQLRSGVLGQAAPTVSYANVNGFPRRNTFYPVALAEKLARRPINPDTEPDITASFNSIFTWYFGTDGKTPSSRTDLVTVVLHELGHGLGFIDGLNYTNGIGSWGETQDSYTNIFTQNILDLRGNFLIRAYKNNTVELGTQMVSGGLTFFSPLDFKAEKEFPRLYTPLIYSGGSSISHLDTDYYATNSPSALMRHSVGAGISIHNPGSITLNMFSDMGWNYTVADHTALKETEVLDKNYEVKAKFYSDSTFIADSLFLRYSIDSFKTEVKIKMPKTAVANEYAAFISATGKPQKYFYYFEAKDPIRKYRMPENVYYTFQSRSDTVLPVIDHSPISFANLTDENLDFSAQVTDNIGITIVELEYLVNDVPKGKIEMKAKDDKSIIYNAKIDLKSLNLKANDVIKYRVVATDKSFLLNKAFFPKTDFQKVKILGIPPTVNLYANNFNDINSALEDFAGNGFTIKAETGFQDGAIHSDHPYKNAGGDNSLNFIYQLRAPIRVRNTNAYMQFDEIVLAEPGEKNSVYTQPEFYDYVIVEGSKDQGKTWRPLLDGYDSRIYPEWLDRYNSASVGQNSAGLGDPSLFKSRLINLRNTFAAGDEILIRFLLHSDPFAVGWGWAIDNLQIQTPNTGLEDYLSQQPQFQVFPNPSNGRMTLKTNLEKNVKSLQISVSNVLGQEIYTQKFENAGADFEQEIDLSEVSNGIYYVRWQADSNSWTQKLLISK
ncbi:MAG: T9SS C-terminal target domain-containing protein [Bacteroidetes bacterium]|nr:MAG: T9SS C-terminal target domain-containing protein [Bacteroidota bacterium]